MGYQTVRMKLQCILTIDGVTFLEMLADEIISISCDMNPPGGWVNRKINMKTGEVVG